MAKGELRSENLEEQAGIEGERYIENFEKRAFPSLIVDMRKTEGRDANDEVGVDFVWDVQTEDGIRQLGVDVTDPEKERRQTKVRRLMHTPCVVLYDNENNPITEESIPRVLINYRLGYFLLLGRRAEQSGGEVYDQMTEKEQKDIKREQLDQILNQTALLSQRDSDYRNKVREIRKAFQKERDSLR